MKTKILDALANAHFWRKVNLFQIVFWSLLIPIAFVTGLANLTWFVTLLSLIALVLSAQASWQSSRNEAKEDERDPDTPTP